MFILENFGNKKLWALILINTLDVYKPTTYNNMSQRLVWIWIKDINWFGFGSKTLSSQLFYIGLNQVNKKERVYIEDSRLI